MKAKKKLKKIKKILNGRADLNMSNGYIIDVISDIIHLGIESHQDKEEPEPEFEPGDSVRVDVGIPGGYEFRVDALEGHGGLKGQIKVSAWVEPQDIEKI